MSGRGLPTACRCRLLALCKGVSSSGGSCSSPLALSNFASGCAERPWPWPPRAAGPASSGFGSVEVSAAARGRLRQRHTRRRGRRITEEPRRQRPRRRRAQLALDRAPSVASLPRFEVREQRLERGRLAAGLSHALAPAPLVRAGALGVLGGVRGLLVAAELLAADRRVDETYLTTLRHRCFPCSGGPGLSITFRVGELQEA